MKTINHHITTRFIALALVLTLMLCAAPSAMAETKYNTTILKLVSSLSASEVTNSTDNRALCSVLIMLDYMTAAGFNSDNMDFFSSIKIACYGSSVDIYFPLKSGRYLNLFYSPSAQTITDYGYSYGPSSSQYYYYSVTPSDFIEALGTVNSLVSK